MCEKLLIRASIASCLEAMKASNAFFVVLVTAPDLKTARRLARAALEARCAACVNLVPGIESHYWWQEKLDRSREVLLLLKTTSGRLKALEQIIVKYHPYDTPEFIVLPIRHGTRRYLQWLKQSCSP